MPLLSILSVSPATLPQPKNLASPRKTCFPFGIGVGGRFSLWSAVGLPVLIALGPENYSAFLSGAREVDEHFTSAPAEQNIPLMSALFATWNTNFLGTESLAILPYDQRLDLLTDFLQQLEMESNGKSVTQEGEHVSHTTMPVLWGGVGTNGQHAYHQFLHQGTRRYAARFYFGPLKTLIKRVNITTG